MNDQFSKPEEVGSSQNKAGNASLPYSDQEWITVDEAVIYFRALGLPRSPEAIRGYCRAKKLEATTTQGIKGEQHVIKRESAKVFIEDRKSILAAMSRNDAEDAGTSRKLSVTSATYRNVPEEAGTAPPS